MQRSSDRCFEVFPTPLWAGNIPDAQLLGDAERLAYEFWNSTHTSEPALVSEAWNRRERSNDREEFKRYGVTSFATDNLIHRPEWGLIARAIKGNARELLNDAWTVEHLEIANMWTTIYPENCFVPEHIHSTFLVSGVFYVKAPEGCGDIVFRDPSWATKTACSNCETTFPISGTRERWTPMAGDLLLFPSWLPHYTDPNQNSEDRIIISFNLRFPQMPTGKPAPKPLSGLQ